jgi:hypothetical protein
MLHGAILRSPVACGRIRRIDVSRARSLAGVRAVVSATEAPKSLAGWVIQDTPLFARDVVRYAGEPLAAVAADSLSKARAAVAAIDIEIEESPAVSTIEEALKPNAPRIHPQLADYDRLPNLDLSPHGNVATEWTHQTAGFGEAFRMADRVVEDSRVIATVVIESAADTSTSSTYGIASPSSSRCGRVKFWLKVKPLAVVLGGNSISGPSRTPHFSPKQLEDVPFSSCSRGLRICKSPRVVKVPTSPSARRSIQAVKSWGANSFPTMTTAPIAEKCPSWRGWYSC